MTYGLAIKCDDGVVFAADTRTNAGVDYVTSYRKLVVFDRMPDRAFVLLSAGNLGVSQEVRNLLTRDLAARDGRENLASVRSAFEVADYVGRTLRAVLERHAAGFRENGVNGATSLIVGGQIQGDVQEIFLVYPAGNYISASDETPYLQIGETKYGKPMLDRLVMPKLSLGDAARLALVSLDATVRSNITVGLPFDVAVYARDSLRIGRQMRLDQSSPFLKALRADWQQGLGRAFAELPRFEWEAGTAQDPR